MEQYILKNALAAEIKKKIRTEQGYSSGDAECGYRDCARDILSFLDTLEVKGVDLDKECRKYLTEHFNVYEDGILQSKRSGTPLDTFDVIQVAKHFFELGLKTKGE